MTETTAPATGTLITGMLLKELEREAVTTRRMLERVPDDKYDWKPHEKSMTIRKLTAHIAELPGWVEMTLKTNELDFAKQPYSDHPVQNTKEVLAFFEKTLAGAIQSLKNATDELLEEEWTLRNGEQVYYKAPKSEMIRTTYSQIVHHRAQLGVFLRLLDVPLPGSYGPTADEGFM